MSSVTWLTKRLSAVRFADGVSNAWASETIMLHSVSQGRQVVNLVPLFYYTACYVQKMYKTLNCILKCFSSYGTSLLLGCALYQLLIGLVYSVLQHYINC